MKKLITASAIIMVLIISACQNKTKSNSADANLKDIAYEAFIYSYPMMEQLKTVNAMKQFMGSEINKPSMNPNLPWNSVGMPIVAPNLTSMTGGIWLDLSKQPITVEIPEIKDRYNVFQCIDVFTHNFFYMGSRATKGEGGQYTFYMKGQELPQNNSTPVLVEGDKVMIVVRIDIEDESEHEKVIALQNAIKVIDPPSENASYPTYDEEKAFSTDFVEYVNELLTEVPEGEDEIFERFSKIGIFNRVDLSDNELAEVKSGIDSAFSAIKTEVENLQVGNGYIGATEVFGTREFLNGNYLGRATGAFFGLWGNSKEEANYYMLFEEGEGKIIFKKEDLPPLSEIGFWSITMHDEDVLVHKNKYDSYVITMDKMKFEEDGSLIINFSSTPNGDNWLYTPGDKIAILIRVYQPNVDRIGSYVPPAFQRMDPKDN
jgi:hypothetical protein